MSLFLLENYKIFNVEIDLEKFITSKKDKNGRIDIFAKIEGEFGKKKKIFLVIENKVKAKEHDEQTIKYFDYFTALQQSDKALKEEAIFIYVYQTPLSNYELDNLVGPECACKEFIQINYQLLVDYILEPALERNIPLNIKQNIEDYLKSLKQPVLENNKSKNKIIMAMGEEERKLLTSFWENHEDLIMASLDALYDDPNLDEDTRNKIKTTGDKLNSFSKTRKEKFKFRMKGETLFIGEQSPFGKNPLVHAIVKDFCDRNNSITIGELKKKFPDKLHQTYGVFQEVNDVRGKYNANASKLYKIDKKEIITLANGNEIATTSQWGAGPRWEKFLKHVEKLNYEIVKTN